MLKRENYALPSAIAISVVLIIAVAFTIHLKPAFSMGIPPSLCLGQYNYTLTSFTITVNGQTYDPLSNPGLTFNADNSKGYDVTFTVHTASQNQEGNTSAGTIWYENTIYGYGDGVCADGVNAGQDKTVSITGIIAGQQHNKQDSNGQGLDLTPVEWTLPQYNTVTYNVKWFSPSNFPSSSSNSNTTELSSSSSSPSTTTPSNATTTATSSQLTTSPNASNTTTTPSTNSTPNTTITTTSIASIPTPQVPKVNTTIVRQGTIASNAAGNLINTTILAPTPEIVYTGTISYASGTPVDLYILHTYPITSSQQVKSTFGAPLTVVVNGQTYAASVLSSNADQRSGSSGFSGNGLLLVSKTGPFIASFTLQASVGAPIVSNDFTNALNSTSTSSSAASTITP